MKRSTQASLRRIKKNRLLETLSTLVEEDRGNTARMIAYIGEIDRRKLYLEHAYPSMFAFCTKHFRMSEAIAGKRIRAGRAACAFPCILDMIRAGELHLSAVHQLAGHLTKENHKEVLRRAKHRSMREVDELIAEIAPRPDGHSIMRAMRDGRTDEVRELEGAAAAVSSTDGAPKAAAERGTDSSGGQLPIPSSSVKNLTIPLSPRRYRLHVTIGQEARDTLEELQNLLSHQIPNGDPALIVERALEVLLADTKKKRAAVTDKPRPKKRGSAKRTRAIPADVRREVFERDEGRCTFVDGNGRRCDSSWQLEFHHCTPYGREGPHTVENIALRCRAHNQYEAELEYGKAFMDERRKSA